MSKSGTKEKYLSAYLIDIPGSFILLYFFQAVRFDSINELNCMLSYYKWAEQKH